MNDLFSKKAIAYDQDEKRVDNVDQIAKAIVKSVTLSKSMHLMDFGSGTGLLLERIAPHVKKITAVDISSAMNDQLGKKKHAVACDLEILEMDLVREAPKFRFDGIISSMTMHHIKDIDAIFTKFYHLLRDGGFIAISDLDSEDGSFHTEDTGVYHFGFDREDFKNQAQEAGFKNVKTLNASVMRKAQGEYPVFLLIADK